MYTYVLSTLSCWSQATCRI